MDNKVLNKIEKDECKSNPREYFSNHVLRQVRDHIYWAYHPVISKYLYKNVTGTYFASNY